MSPEAPGESLRSAVCFKWVFTDGKINLTDWVEQLCWLASVALGLGLTRSDPQGLAHHPSAVALVLFTPSSQEPKVSRKCPLTTSGYFSLK